MSIRIRCATAAVLVVVPLLAHAQAPAPSGRDLAAACAICHGTNGVSKGAMPVLAGQSREMLQRNMRDLRDGKRPATVMHQLGKGYTDAEIEAMAGFFATQKVQ